MINTEVEVRFNCNNVKSLLESLTAPSETYQIISVLVEEGKSTKIKENHYKAGIKSKVNYVSKTRTKTVKINDSNNLLTAKSINVSEEKQIREFTVPPNSKARCKLRQSFKYENYVVDITLVIPIMKVDEGKLVIKEIFTPELTLLEAEEFCISNKIMYLMEVELELKGSDETKVQGYINEFLSIKGGSIIDQFGNAPLKTTLPKVITLTRKLYSEIYKKDGYYLSVKIDGERMLCVIENKQIKLYNMKREITETYSCDYEGDLILDGELVDKTFYIFDLVSNEIFSKRLNSLSKLKIKSDKLKIELKQFEPFKGEKELVKSMYEKTYDFKIDGLILVKDGDTYSKTISYKFKEIKDNTIDFYVKNSELYVGIDTEMRKRLGLESTEVGKYTPIRFTPHSDPFCYRHVILDKSIDGKIGEFVFEDDSWKLVRLREDKFGFGNDYRIAESNWLNYMDVLTLEQLWEGTGDQYFISSFTANTRPNYVIYTSIIKGYRISMIEANSTVIDFGYGRGQDLKRYLDIRLKHLIGIDNDTAALVESVSRHYDLIKTTDYSTLVNVINLDCTTNHDKIKGTIKEKLNIENSNYINCNLALHYFIGPNEDNFVKLIDSLLLSGGKFSFICFIGEAVVKLFEDKKIKPGEIYTNDKLSLKRHKGDKKVGVLLPFSSGYVDEYLMYNSFIEKFKKIGYQCSSDKPLIDYLPKIKTILNFELEEYEVEYLSLYGDFVLIKPGSVRG